MKQFVIPASNDAASDGFGPVLWQEYCDLLDFYQLPLGQVEVVSSKDEDGTDEDQRVKRLTVKCGANERDERQSQKVDRHHDVWRREGERRRETEVRKETRAADHDKPWECLCRREGDLSVIACEYEAE